MLHQAQTFNFQYLTILIQSLYSNRLIKELKMTEPVFEIISRKRTQSHKSKQESSDSYAKLMEEYLSKSYGYYIELFLKRICQKAQQQHQKLLKFQLRKLLRQFVSKYMMTDLEIIFFSYFADLHQWNFAHSVIQKSITKNQANNELNQINEIRLFLHLVCFFVKSYVGDKAEVSALIEFHNQNLPLFCEIYQMWVQNNDKKVFQISPRDLNQIYSEHSRNCGQKSTKRDYNKMVDRILDLSTSYSMVPAKQKSSKQRKSSSRVSRQQIPQVSQYAQMPQPSPQKVRSMRQIQPSNIWQQQNSFRFDFSDLRFSKRQSIVLSNLQQQKASGSRVDQSNNSGKGVTGGHKKISLNKKKKDEVNNMAKNFFRGKDINVSVQDIKKNENSLRDIMPNSFLDLNGHSSRIESLPIPYRNNSNLFGPSTLF